MSEVTALAPWYGSNRMLAKHVGEELKGCNWVGVPFAGGMTEIAQIKARTINVNDKHRHIMNLACYLGTDEGPTRLLEALDHLPFHPDTLAYAQNYCREMERAGFEFGTKENRLDEKWAVNYFITCWMTRAGSSGTDAEFTAGISTRWSASGGDSNVRFRSATAALLSWGQVMRRCNFTCLDFREFLDHCHNKAGHGVYCDPPFPGPGDKYTHNLGPHGHDELAERLRLFISARVVIRYYDVPMIRELYPEPQWTWRHLTGRKQTNDAAPEVLIINGPSYAK